MAHGDNSDDKDQVCFDAFIEKMSKMCGAELAKNMLTLIYDYTQLASSCHDTQSELEEVQKEKSMLETKVTSLERTCVNASDARVDLANELQTCMNELSVVKSQLDDKSGSQGGSQTGSQVCSHESEIRKFETELSELKSKSIENNMIHDNLLDGILCMKKNVDLLTSKMLV